MKYIVCLLLIVQPTWAQSFEPGLWASKESLELNGLPLPSSTDEECITPDQAKDAKATYQEILPATAVLKLSGQWVKVCKK